MIRSAVLVCAAIIAAAGFACAPVPPPAAPPPIFAVAAAAVAATPAPACDATPFTNKAYYFNTPVTIGPGQPAPPITTPAPANYKAGLAAAYCAAPPNFQQQLLKLDAVYVNDSTCVGPSICFSQSWAWLQSKPTFGNGRLVALSAAMWNEPTYSKYESDLTQSIFPYSHITYSQAQPQDTPAMALLAALAHEVGHLRWFDLVQPLADPNTFCAGKFFPQWERPVRKVPLDPHGRYFRSFLDLAERRALRQSGHLMDHHIDPPHIKNIDDPQPGDPSVPSMVFGLVDTGSPWASPFAAVSPDEDFVETYKFAVLTSAATNPRLTSVIITVPGGGTADIVAQYLTGSRPRLGTKVGCIPATF